jgi:hypothetical protein
LSLHSDVIGLTTSQHNVTVPTSLHPYGVSIGPPTVKNQNNLLFFSPLINFDIFDPLASGKHACAIRGAVAVTAGSSSLLDVAGELGHRLREEVVDGGGRNRAQSARD